MAEVRSNIQQYIYSTIAVSAKIKHLICGRIIVSLEKLCQCN